MRNARSVVIIGGGVAGLSAAALLSREGWRVQVLEANSKIGGCCATTDVNGYTFNDGALYLAMPSLLDHLFRKVGLDRAADLPLRRISAIQTSYLPDGTVVTIGAGPEIRVDGRERAGEPGLLHAELAAFLNKWEPVLRVFADDLLLHPFSPYRLVARSWRQMHRMRGTVSSQMAAAFSDSAVGAALSGALLYTGMPPERIPALFLIGLAAMFRDGLFLPEGGMGSIPESLGRAVRRNGGEIHLRSPVTRICVRNGRVSGVDVAPGGFIDADAVISTVSGMHTFGTLMEPRDVPRRMRRRLRRVKLSHRGYVLQLGLRTKIEAPSHSMYVLPQMEGQHAVFRPVEQDAVPWPIYAVPTVTMPELAPADGSIVEMYPPIRQDLTFDDWTEERKAAVAERGVAALKRMHGISDRDIAVRRILSPKEFEQSTHLYDGALYGLSPVAGPMTLFPHRSGILGLYQAGQTTWPGFGVGGAAVSGVLAAEVLINDAVARLHVAVVHATNAEPLGAG